MTELDEMATDYWLSNATEIYKGNHVSQHIIDAYKSGFNEAKSLAIRAFRDSEIEGSGLENDLSMMGREEEYDE